MQWAPRPSGEKARDRIASPAEAAALIAAMRPTDRATLGCAVYAGLRLGELLALDVPAIDLESGWIHVHRSWDREGKQFVSTKSRKPRKVPIIDKLAILLADHFVLLDHPSEGLLFPSANNPEWPTDAGILRRRTRARWKEAGLKPLGFHEGRHTYASIGIAAGLNPKTLSTYLGHATITITLDRYGHLMPGSEVEARAMLDTYLANPRIDPQ
jgi:integrase